MSVTSIRSQMEEAFQCPITLDLIQHPVIDPCGHTFEERAIRTWVDRTHQCPVSKNGLEQDQLHPNRAVALALEILAQLPDNVADLHVLDDERRERLIEVHGRMAEQLPVPRADIPEGFLAKLRAKIGQTYC